MATDYQECKYCRTRIIFPRDATGKKLPPVNYGPDPQGTVSVWHDVRERGGWLGRFLAGGEQVRAPAHKHALHWCDGLKRHRQRGDWTAAITDLHKQQQRGRHQRKAPQPSGYVVVPLDELLRGEGEPP